LFQNFVSFGTSFRKSGLEPAFSIKSEVTVPKTEVLEQPQLYQKTSTVKRVRNQKSEGFLITEQGV